MIKRNKKLPIFRYYQLTQQFQNQLNGYRYCWNNPLRYTDPDGHFSPFVKDLIWFAAGVLYTEFCTGFPLTKTAIEFWKEQWGKFCEWMASQGKDWEGDWIEWPPRNYD